MKIIQRWTVGNDQYEHVAEIGDELVFTLPAAPVDVLANVEAIAANLRRALAANPLTWAANESTIRTKAEAALATNDTFLALANPTNAQYFAQLKVVTRECTGLIRLLLKELDSTAGT